MHTVYLFGTPEFAVPSLAAIASLPDCRLQAVITETDKPAGRGQRLSAPALKVAALERGIRVLQPSRLRGVAKSSSVEPLDDDARALRNLLLEEPPDVCITVAYGKILPKALLEQPRCGFINVHASLLPRWRGAAPIQRALLAGDRETGVCLMQTEVGLDTGPVYATIHTEITADDTYGSLHDRLAALGATALSTHLPSILQNTLSAEPQSEEGVTYAEKWTSADAHINWSESAEIIERRIRANNPRPAAFSEYGGETRVRIFAASIAPNYSYSEAAPGTIVDVQRKAIVIACGGGSFIAPQIIQIAGRKQMAISSAMQGFPFTVGERFS